MTVEQAYEVHF